MEPLLQFFIKNEGEKGEKKEKKEEKKSEEAEDSLMSPSSQVGFATAPNINQ
jgi:hypothetical protein